MLALIATVGTALVAAIVGGTIAAIKALTNKYIENMQDIINRREEELERLRNMREKELHRSTELRRLFEIFKVEVEQARKIVEEAEYTDRNGRKIKGYDGK